MNKLSIFKVTYMHSSSHKKEKLLYFSENKKMKINILILIYISEYSHNIPFKSIVNFKLLNLN